MKQTQFKNLKIGQEFWEYEDEVGNDDMIRTKCLPCGFQAVDGEIIRTFLANSEATVWILEEKLSNHLTSTNERL